MDWNPGTAVSASLASQAMAAVEGLCGDAAHPMSVDVSGVGSLDRAARAVFAQPSTPSRIALLGISQVDRVLANAVLASP